MKKNKKAMFAGRRGFTLIELLVTIAIISILAAVVLVSMTSYAKKARSSRALAQLSSTIPSIIACYGNGMTPNQPTTPGGGNFICGSDSSYGRWPSVWTGTDLSTWGYGSGFNSDKTWYVRTRSMTDGFGVCCNGVMKNCKIQTFDGIGWNEDCLAGSPLN